MRVEADRGPGEPVGRRDLLGRPFHDLRMQALLLAVADQDPLQVRDLLRRPTQQLPAIPRRVLVGLLGRRLPGIAPIRCRPGPGRGSPFRVVEPVGRVVFLLVGLRAVGARWRDFQAGQEGHDPAEVLGASQPGLVDRHGDFHVLDS